MILSQIRDLALSLANSLSADGTRLPDSDVSDFKFAFNSFLNTAQNKFAEKDKIEAIYSVTQNPIPNLLRGSTTYDNTLAVDDAFDITQHLDADIIFSAIGAKSYYFEVDKFSTVYIEESISGVWTNLATVNTPSTVTSFTPYSGLITPSNILNSVRMRFSGAFPYNLRRAALYGYTFSSIADIPPFTPYMKYPLPIDYLSLNKIIENSDERLHRTFIDYSIEKRNLLINYSYTGSFDLYYFKYPTPLVLDTDSPEIQSQYHGYLAYFVAGTWLFTTGQQTNGIVLLNMFDSFLQEITPPIDEHNGTIANYTGW